ncbi:hypothetical protein [Hyalangium gracile]|uniref:hypothetical protein n=1 Tax=Hyalangium gracile TaxID=394092 RepID=UPI001CCA28BD|nr:hypothetical protein [Hyalangium gracile]
MDTPQTQGTQAPASDPVEARWVRYALFLALGLPAFLPLNFVYRFGVNVPFWDQWEFVPLLVSFHEGHLTLAELTAQHNEHRLFFPRLIMLGLAALTRYNALAEMYLNVGLLLALGAVLLQAHVRAFGASNRSLLAFLPVPWLVFTFRQSENLVWGWQLQITLCVLCGVVSLRLLEGVRGLGARWAGAAAAAFVATFSFGSGLALWPVGLIALLWQGRREGRTPWRAVLGWVLAAALAYGLFAWGFQRPGHHPEPQAFLKKPVDSVLFMLATLGSVTSDTFPTAVAFGALLLVGAGGVLLEVRRGRVEDGPTTFALGLILFAGAAAFLVLVGRAGFGREYGLTSRYSTFTLLGFVGLHRALLTLREPSRRGLLMGVLLCAAMTSGFWSFTSGLDAGYILRNQGRQNREALLTFETRKDEELERMYGHVSLVRQRAVDLRRLELSVFAPKR